MTGPEKTLCEQRPDLLRLMESRIGRKLEKGEEIHHLTPDASKIEEIQLMRTAAMHYIHHNRPNIEDILMDLTRRLALRTNCGQSVTIGEFGILEGGSRRLGVWNPEKNTLNREVLAGAGFGKTP